MRTCSKCHETKPEFEFYRNGSKASGFASRCKVCDRAGRSPYKEKRNADALAPYRARISAQLGLDDVPGGCEGYKTSFGVLTGRCPYYEVCTRLPADAPVMCELSEAEADIDVTIIRPDAWLAETHEPLRPISGGWLWWMEQQGE